MAEALNISKIKIGEDEYELKDEWARDNAGKYSPDVDEAKEELKFEEGTSGGGGGSSKVIVKTGEVKSVKVNRDDIVLNAVEFDEPMPDTHYIIECNFDNFDPIKGEGYMFATFSNKTENGFNLSILNKNTIYASVTCRVTWQAIHIS